MRGLSALLVMVGHLRSVLFLPYNKLKAPDHIDRVIYFITGYGHQCVMIFFVLSGYFVGGPFITNYHTSTLNSLLTKYTVNRLTRLWVVLVPALVLTLTLDFIGVRLSLIPTIYSDPNFFPYIHLTNDSKIITLIGNLLFLQTTLVPTFGSDAPLWSLANEFWYYLLFPIMYLIINLPGQKIVTKLWLAFLATIILLFLIIFNSGLLIYFLIWLVGVVVYYFQSKLNMSRPVLVLSIVQFLITMLLLRTIESTYGDFLLGISSGIFLFAILKIDLHPLLNTSSQFLSKISYTLYATHLPIIIFIKAVIIQNTILDNSILSYCVFIVLTSFIIFLCYILYFLFERNTNSIRIYTMQNILKLKS